MSKISDAFSNGKALVAFLTCGDPDLETTEKLICAVAQGGADLIELGIPFSDPTAEGPAVQAANLRALAAGTTTDKIFDTVRRVRKKVSVPLVFTTYANVLFAYGTERFLQKAAEAGMDGIILPDVPFEEKEEFAPLCHRYGLDFISLIAPASQERISAIAGKAQGFAYCIPSLENTGFHSQMTCIDAMVPLVRKAADIPVVIGSDISTPEQALAMANRADGIIVDSAVVKCIAEYGREAELPVRDYVAAMKNAISRAE